MYKLLLCWRYLRSIARLPVVGTMLASSLGCSVQTVHPLSEAGQVTRDSGLVGEWTHIDTDFPDSNMKVIVSKDRYGYLIVEDKKERPVRLSGKLIAIGEDRYLELISDGTENDSVAVLDTKVPAYLFVRIERNDDRLTVWRPKFGKLKDAVSNGSLTGVVTHSRVILTSPAEHIVEYLQANRQLAFDKPVVYQRFVDKDAQ